jgi:hypothetical protein
LYLRRTCLPLQNTPALIPEIGLPQQYDAARRYGPAALGTLQGA